MVAIKLLYVGVHAITIEYVCVSLIVRRGVAGGSCPPCPYMRQLWACYCKHSFAYHSEQVFVLSYDGHPSPAKCLNDPKEPVSKADLCCAELEVSGKPLSVGQLSGGGGT